MLKCKTSKGQTKLEFQNSIGEYKPIFCDSLAEMWAVAFALHEYEKAIGKKTPEYTRTGYPVLSLYKGAHSIGHGKHYNVWIEEVRI